MAKKNIPFLDGGAIWNSYPDIVNKQLTQLDLVINLIRNILT